ncbi:MAG: SAM-dependent methyltransferase [Clostridia bacterium]|nr:SAM-dependent methyltransferase [Clostridia bacterium]
MNPPKISKRLEAAASFVRRGKRIADIGTDHAYLPIYLYTTGAVSGGVVSDINQGPVERAVSNLHAYGAERVFAAQKADGLCGVLEYEPEDIFILGMGGELIARIIEDEPRIKDARYRLILQPMTHPELLREYLFGAGFDIIDECLVDEDKIYQIICAEYRGISQTCDSLELYFGRCNLAKKSEELYALMKRTRRVLLERIKGKNISGADTRYEDCMIGRIDEFLAEEK